MGDINLEIKLKNVSESVEGLKELIEAFKPLTASGDIEIVDNVIKIKSDLENVNRIINAEFITLSVGNLKIDLNADDDSVYIAKDDNTYINMDSDGDIYVSTSSESYRSVAVVSDEALSLTRGNKVGDRWTTVGHVAIEDNGVINIYSTNRINLDCTADGVYVNDVKIGG